MRGDFGESAVPLSGDVRLSLRVQTALLLFALALRLPTLALRRIVEGDGVHYAQLARAIVVGDFSGLANPYWSNLWPAVIAAMSWLTGLDVVAVGRALSLLAGSLLAVVAARLAARCFGPTTGVVAGLLVAGHPWLIHFSTLLFTESFFALLLTTMLLAAMSAARGMVPASLAGLVGGLAIVTRPEAYSAGAVALVWVVLCGWSQSRRSAALRGLLFAGAVALCVAGRGYMVHHYFGMWDFGVGLKGTANLLVGIAETDRERERLATEITGSGGSRLQQTASETGIVSIARVHPGALAQHLARNLVRLLSCAARVFSPIPPVGSWATLRGELSPFVWMGLLGAVFVVGAVGMAGLVAGVHDGGSRHASMMLAAVGGLYLLGLAPLYVHQRLVVALVPLFLVFVAHGVALVAGRQGVAHDGRARTTLTAVLAVVGVLLLGLLMYAPVLDYGADRVVQRHAGEWLAAHYSEDAVIMTAAPAVGFYFYDAYHQENERTLPWADFAGVMARAREWGVRLLVVPDWHLEAVDHPAAAVLLHPEKCPASLRHVATLGEAGTGRILIYDLGPPAA